MAKFNAEEYKKILELSTDCKTCEKVPIKKCGKNDSYIFISYSHEDYKQVYCDLADLYESDIPFWYDDGLPAGIDWDDIVREKMTDSRCKGVIFYLSENLLLSKPIQTEIRIVLGEDTEMPMPNLKRDYFCVNLTDKKPSDILSDVFPKKRFPDSDDEMAEKANWTNTLAKAFPNKSTYLTFSNPNHKQNLVQQIISCFGINPNYNPFEFSSATFHSGNGVIEFESGAVYEGDFRDGLFDGKGKLSYPNNAIYNGEWKNGKWHGQGTMNYPNGGSYAGEWKDGNRHGQGTMTYPNGLSYTGEWKDGQQNGQGTMNYPDGGSYAGEWKDYKWHGQGTITYPDGGSYAGEWKDGQWHGQGTITYPDGSSYTGEWKDSEMHGQGTMNYSNGASYTGEWKDSEMHGQGTMNYTDGASYTGEWKDGKKHGQGTIIFSDGESYTGEWVNDEMHGKFIHTQKDGTKTTLFFENGKPIDSKEQ